MEQRLPIKKQPFISCCTLFCCLYFFTCGFLQAQDFKPKVDFATGSNPLNVAIADLDGDGKPEMVAINKDDNTVSVYWNISSAGTITTGSFAAKVDYATLSEPRAVAIGDLDGDGKPDLIITNDADGSVSILRNKTQPGGITASSFADQVDFTASASPAGVAVGDLDGDGKLDFAVVNTFNNSIFLYHNIISVPGAITQSSFEPPVVINLAPGTVPVSIAIGDLDGDEKPELVVTNANGGTNPSLSVFRNTASVGSLSVNSFASTVNFAVPSNPTWIAIGDLDGDGKPDLISTDYATAQLSIFRNTATPGTINAGSFAPRVDTRTAVRPRKVVIGDFNGDQRPDLAVIGEAAKNMSVFLNISSKGSISTNSFAPRADYTAGNGHFSLATGDLDGDGKADLVVANGGYDDSDNALNTLSVFRSELPKVYYVTPKGTGDGSSWLNASGNLQAMINAASPHDEIWVAAGTYQPTANTSFSMVEGVGIYGGFAGTENSRSERSWNTNVTTLQGNGSTVVVSNNVSNLTVLDGFTITGGNLPTGHGGGISNQNSSPVLSNLIISGNNANDGAGISNDNSSPQIVNCLIIKNNATWATGIFNFNSSTPVITNCTITANIASQQGGGINNAPGTNSIINNSILYGNKDSGGYLYTMNMRTEYRANTTINYSLVEGASTTGTGNIFGDPLFTNETAGDYSLQSGSPAINAGDPETNTAGYAVQVGNTDLAGNMRVQAGQVDMGVFESPFTPVIPANNITPDNNNILYVNSAVANGDRSGNSWDNALPELADALKWARQNASRWSAAPLQIWVAKGTYKPLYSPVDGDDDKDNTRYNAFLMVANVEVYGGFAGTESDRNQRNWQRNVTILSGDRRMPNDKSDNTYKVVAAVNDVGSATLDGFTVTGGYADNAIANGSIYGKLSYNFSGGGILIYNASLKVANCIITGNQVTSYGGGVYNVTDDINQHPTFTNCLFTGNIAGRTGGAIMNDALAWCKIINCTIVGNQAEWDGGGLGQLDNTELTIISNSIIWGNSAGGNSQSESASYNYWGDQPNFSYSIVANMSQSGTNIVADPLFTNVASGDYSLLIGSPAVNAGDPQTNNAGYVIQAGALDLAANNRVQVGQVDIGAYESPYSTVPSVQASQITFTDTKNSSTTINWTTGNGQYRAVFMAATDNGSPAPVNGTVYIANASFGTADTQIGSSGWYCVYTGTGNATSVTSLSPNSTYRVMVVEYNGSDTDLLYNLTAATDNPANVTTTAKTDQTITIDAAIPDKVYGDPDFDISAVAIASSGLPVVYSVLSGPAAINGSIVTITGAGPVEIAIDQSGDGQFNPAPRQTTSFFVDKATATLALSDLTQTYEDRTPKFVTVTTIPAGLGTVSVTYNGSGNIPTDAGRYDVVASLRNPNYTAADVTGTLIIDPADLTGVAFEDQTFVYDGTEKRLTIAHPPAASSIVYSNNWRQTNAGTYTVTAVVRKANYKDLTLTADLIIKRAEAVITAGEVQSFVYDGMLKSVVATLNHSESQLTYDPQQSYTDAGSYRITIDAAQSQNYEAASKMVTLNISKGPILGVTLADLHVIYDGKPHSLSVAGLPQDATVTYDVYDQVNVNTYPVVATVSAPNHEDLVLRANLFIDPATVTLALSNLVQAYDGTPKIAAVTTTPAGLESSVTVTYDGSVTAPTDAGTYAVVGHLDNPNYTAPDAKGTLTIGKATITGVTLAGGTFTYDGRPHSLAVTGLPHDATVNYSDNDQINAGTYTVTAIVSQPNHDDLTLTAKLIINRAKAVIRADLYQSFVYGGQEKFATGELNHNETQLVYTPQQSYVDVGVYPITISAAQTQNYEAASVSVILEVLPAQLRGVTLAHGTFTYDGTVKSLAVAGAPADATITYTGNDQTDAGSYTVKAVVSKLNFEDLTLTAHLVINKARATLALSNLNHTYDGTPKPVTVTTTPAWLESIVTITYDGSQTAPTNAGTYKVAASLNNANYTASEVTGTLVIKPATITGVTLAGRTFTYDGRPHSLAVAGLPADATVKYTNNDKTNTGSYTVTAVVSQPNHDDLPLTAQLVINRAASVITADPVQTFVYDGTPKPVAATLNHSESPLTYDPQQSYTGAGTYHITVRAAQSQNYEAASKMVMLTVNKGAPAITWHNPEAITYGTALSAAQLNATAGIDGTFVYNPAAGTVLAIGEHTLKVTFTPADGVNYTAVSKEVILVVKEAAPALITWNTPAAITYGTALSAAQLNATADMDGDFVYSPAAGTVLPAGDHTLKATFIPADASYGPISKEVVITVKKAPIQSVQLENKEFVFDGTEHALAVSGTLPPGASVSYSNNSQTGAGSQEVTATITGGKNYADLILKAALTVIKARQAITFDEIGTVTRDAGTVTLSVKSSSGLPVSLTLDDSQVAVLSGTNLNILRLGMVKITATQTGNENYEAAAPVSITVKVAEPGAAFPVRVHKALSPNGDGINDFLMIEGIKDYPDNRVVLVDRNGVVLYDHQHYDNKQVAFRGRLDGRELPAGTYFYLVELHVNGKWERLKGYFLIQY